MKTTIPSLSIHFQLVFYSTLLKLKLVCFFLIAKLTIT
jgi:hypothetical protein